MIISKICSIKNNLLLTIYLLWIYPAFEENSTFEERIRFKEKDLFLPKLFLLLSEQKFNRIESSNRPSADVCKKITFFLLSFLENYSKICNNCLSWSFGNRNRKYFNEGKKSKISGNSKNTCLSNLGVFQKNDSKKNCEKLKDICGKWVL